ncbi:MAG: 50S ribosomal protein L24 [Phycisphaerales bacterium]|nr:MAG: 50S ribosomal protein L24 [Phycisphaerales bacterium]
MARHIRKGDQVIVTAGDHKGRTGEVMRVDVDRQRVYIKGLNLRTRNVRPTRLNPEGGRVTKEAPIHISNVSPVVDGKPTRVRFVVGQDGKKQRIAVRTGKPLPVVARRRGQETATKDTL